MNQAPPQDGALKANVAAHDEVEITLEADTERRIAKSVATLREERR